MRRPISRLPSVLSDSRLKFTGKSAAHNMNDETNRARSFLERWTRRALTISICFVIWLASGVWAGARRERFLDWNFALQRWWANALCRGAQRIFDISIEVEGAD